LINNDIDTNNKNHQASNNDNKEITNQEFLFEAAG
jgi:hypothetical protein